MEYTEFTDGNWNPLHFLISNVVHTSHTLDIVYTTFNLERWSTQHLLMEMEITVFTHMRWKTQHILMTDGFY